MASVLYKTIRAILRIALHLRTRIIIRRRTASEAAGRLHLAHPSLEMYTYMYIYMRIHIYGILECHAYLAGRRQTNDIRAMTLDL